MKMVLFVYANLKLGHSVEGVATIGKFGENLRSESHSAIYVFAPRPKLAAAQIEQTFQQLGDADVFAFWDMELGPLPYDQIERFYNSKDDVWTPGAVLTGDDEPDFLRYPAALWLYRPAPPDEAIGHINWRLDFRAMFLRPHLFRQLGGPLAEFDTLSGAAREMGLRWLKRGAIIRQMPEMILRRATGQSPLQDVVTLADRYRILRLHHGGKWADYVLARRLLAGNVGDYAAWKKARATGQSPLHRQEIALNAAARDLENVAIPPNPSVSVILPTFGRYRYVAEVLDDLRKQSVRVTQILIADGNPPEAREPDVYAQFADLPLEIIWLEAHQNGTCASRNACLERATGDYIWFVDDDSRLAADNLENHLKLLAGYGADVSVGPAYTPQRPELHGSQREIAVTFMDCGTTLGTRDILEKAGGFDMQFNNHLAGEDGELGIRFVKAGGLMLNNPLAKRFHYLAPVGGARSSRSNVHQWRRWSLLPRPVQSVYYSGRRHFEASAAREGTFLAWLTIGWRRRDGQAATRAWRLKTLLAETIALPLSLFRLWVSVREARRMLREGPGIPPLTLNPSPTRGEGLTKPLNFPFSPQWEKGLGDEGD